MSPSYIQPIKQSNPHNHNIHLLHYSASSIYWGGVYWTQHLSWLIQKRSLFIQTLEIAVNFTHKKSCFCKNIETCIVVLQNKLDNNGYIFSSKKQRDVQRLSASCHQVIYLYLVPAAGIGMTAMRPTTCFPWDHRHPAHPPPRPAFLLASSLFRNWQTQTPRVPINTFWPYPARAVFRLFYVYCKC